MAKRTTGFTKLIISMVFMVVLATIGFNGLNILHSSNEDYVGKKVELDGDTLTIVNTDLYHFTLSNSVKIESGLAKKIIINE